MHFLIKNNNLLTFILKILQVVQIINRTIKCRNRRVNSQKCVMIFYHLIPAIQIRNLKTNTKTLQFITVTSKFYKFYKKIGRKT